MSPPSTLSARWRQTQMTPEQRSVVVSLSVAIASALREGRLDDAHAHAVDMHARSQDDAGLHAYGHWLSARVHLARGHRRPALRHLYLTVMAPYGTFRRRLRGD